MRKVCVITGTRAEYGVLYWVIKGLSNCEDIQLQLCVTGMHLSPEFGLTYKQIEDDGFHIDDKVEMLLSSDTSVGISKSIGLGIIGFADVFERLKPDILLVLGDRFEILASVTAAMIAKIPIAHCHGGEATEGLIDEPIRHSITKMSQIHFTSTDEYRNRVIQLGENPKSVFNVGALGIENINKLNLLNRSDFEKSIDFKLNKRNFLITFHPVTLDNNTAENQFQSLLNVLKKMNETNFIFTKPNADTGGRIIIKMIDEFVQNNNQNSISFISLGQVRYLSALQFVDIVIGNSSSGLVEVPSFKIPTINIGDRQKGRICAGSVINCECNEHDIEMSVNKALSNEFNEFIKDKDNPHGTGNSSGLIINTLKSIDLTDIVKKEFYNINFK